MQAWSPFMQTLSLHIAAILTFCIWSFLYKDNPLYKFAEYLVVGVSAGYYTVIFYNNYIEPNLVAPLSDSSVFLSDKLLLMIPLLLGVLLWTRIFPKYAWLSRYSLAVYLGAAAGLAIPREMDTVILTQLSSTMVIPDSLNIESIFSTVVIIVGVFCTLIYFFFSKPHKGVLGKAARVGIIFIMISFGATFGYTVMGRVSLLIGRVTFLVKEWFPAL
ncbi:MAG: hypothetical protein A2161_01480, partial [Candidatus Schekmanbacteria bacterium RBG_13_48_7]